MQQRLKTLRVLRQANAPAGAEQAELAEFEQIEHLMVMIKAC